MDKTIAAVQRAKIWNALNFIVDLERKGNKLSELTLSWRTRT